RTGAGAQGSQITGAVSGSMRSTAEYAANRAIAPAIIATRVQAEGPVYFVTASPLLGIRRVELGGEAKPKPGLLPSPDATPESEAPKIVDKPNATWTLSGLEPRPRGVARIRRPESLSATEMDTAAPTGQIDQDQNRVHQEVLTRFK